MRGRRGTGWRKSRRYGSEEARRHIAEAQAFSAEVGGVDRDVKSYFFSLSRSELEALLTEYGRKYGADKKQYAEEAYPEWKSGKVKMSGLVAKRLFDLLPTRMPLATKYELVKKLWEHFCPKTRQVFYIGKGSNNVVLQGKVAQHFEKVVQQYFISDKLAAQFEWLSAGDVRVRQQLQNYFQQLKKTYAAQALGERMNIVAAHLGSTPEDHTVQTVKIGNHVVDIKWTNLAEGVLDPATVSRLQTEKRAAEEKEREQEQKIEAQKNAFGCLIAIVAFFLLMRACAN